jgi:predicted PurR-regulated permease PerM
MKKINGVLGMFLGCPIGVVVAVLVSRGQRWEPWLLPE